MKFYAHSLDHDPDTNHWQDLEKHLQNVAKGAAQFAEPFASHGWGYLAGLWHDLGKYHPAFQEKLRGSRLSVEHSGLGAALAEHVNKQLGIPLAFVIAGHHAGLANLIEDGPDLPSPLTERLKHNAALLRQFLPDLPTPLVQHPVPVLPSFLTLTSDMDRKNRDTLTRSSEFWVRFLFSALVDADRLDTEQFLNPAQSKIRGRFASIEELRAQLDAFIDTKMAGLSEEDRTSPVNRARAHVLTACRNAAAYPPGVFSLTVPTGGGKTLSAMSFALCHAQQYRLRRVIVVIPYTSIIEQNAAVYRQALGDANVVEHHTNLDPVREASKRGEEVTRQHALAADNWDAPVIVTTTVQFFESLFSNRPSRCRKLHNIARSVIILDEVQTLPPGFLLSILDALNALTAHYGCSVVLSTATPPALASREGFEYGLAGIRPIIPDPQVLARQLKRVEYIWPDVDAPPLEWPALAGEIVQHEEALVIVHKRDDARLLAQALQLLRSDQPIFHLSALMCAAHRTDVLERIRNALDEGEPCCVVSTQLVEAGVDVDFPIVYRALGGLDSLVQAAGRCNREGRRERGRVIIFRAPTKPPAGTLRRALGIMESLLRDTGHGLDPDDATLFDTYFRMLYFAENQDVHNIQMHRQQFNFATINQEFRLIEDGFTQAVVVPYGAAPERLAAIRRDGAHRETLRGLQPFTVTIYPQAFDVLWQAGALEEIAEGVFALSLVYAHQYDPTFGLIVGETLQADPSALIL